MKKTKIECWKWRCTQLTVGDCLGRHIDRTELADDDASVDEYVDDRRLNWVDKEHQLKADELRSDVKTLERSTWHSVDHSETPNGDQCRQSVHVTDESRCLRLGIGLRTTNNHLSGLNWRVDYSVWEFEAVWWINLFLSDCSVSWFILTRTDLDLEDRSFLRPFHAWYL